MADSEGTFLLLYDYVEDILTKRAPHRSAHLQRIEAERVSGHLLIAGAYGDPPVGAAIAFAGVSSQYVHEWSDADPYVTAGLVRSRSVQPWKLV